MVVIIFLILRKILNLDIYIPQIFFVLVKSKDEIETCSDRLKLSEFASRPSIKELSSERRKVFSNGRSEMPEEAKSKESIM
jgi:hypothetical protein